MKITKVEISQVPNKLPITFVDELQFKNTFLDTTEDNTDITVTEWNKVPNIPVFSRVYSAYKWEFQGKNDIYQAIQNARYAGVVTIYLDNGETHDAFVTEINAENQDNTLFKTITVSYYNKSSLSYVNHHDFDTYPTLLNTPNTELKLKNLESDEVTPKAIDTTWASIIDGNSEFIVNSNFKVLTIEDTNSSESDSETGTSRNNSIFYQNRVAFRGYYSREVAINLRRYLEICNKITITYDATVYAITEPITANIEEIGNDWFRIDFEATYNNEEYYYF